jgi:hypothetical protein
MYCKYLIKNKIDEMLLSLGQIAAEQTQGCPGVDRYNGVPNAPGHRP